MDWGGNAMILGGEVQARQVLGQYPDMDLESDQISNAGRGNFIPMTPLEECYSELALWLGLDEEDLEIVLPMSIPSYRRVRRNPTVSGYSIRNRKRSVGSCELASRKTLGSTQESWSFPIHDGQEIFSIGNIQTGASLRFHTKKAT